MAVDRITPQMSVDLNGKITWMPTVNDYNPELFYRGKTITNNEFNDLFLKEVYQGNYITDSLTALFNKHLSTAIYRSFTSDFNLVPSYVKPFTSTDWGILQEDGYYYITVLASEHGFEADETSSTLDRMNIDTEMYLLGPDGKFYEVTQIDTAPDNTVRAYTDDNTLSGFLVIRTNDKAYALASQVIEASQIQGLANVATSAKYTDLIDINAPTGPNTRISANTSAINSIINGDTVVAEATHAEDADTAVRLLASGYIQNIKVTDIFETGSRYVKDATRAKDYDTTSGGIKDKFTSIEDTFTSAINALTATIANDYYKKTDTVQHAISADTASALNNLPITQDANGVLYIGGHIIPQKKLLYSGNLQVNKSQGAFADIVEVPSEYKHVEVHVKNNVLSDAVYIISNTNALNLDGVAFDIGVMRTLDNPKFQGQYTLELRVNYGVLQASVYGNSTSSSTLFSHTGSVAVTHVYGIIQ